VDTAAQLMTAHIDTTQHQFERRIRDRLFKPTDRSAAAAASPPAPAGPVSGGGTAVDTPPPSTRTSAA
jgi:hypothetical protein